MGTAAKTLDAHLARRLNPTNMSASRQEDLLGLIVRVIAAEAVRYFDFLIADYHLPPVAANHRPRLEEAAGKLASGRTLGEIYSLIWRAARDAASAAQAKREPGHVWSP
jgi:hypothetical protein